MQNDIYEQLKQLIDNLKKSGNKEVAKIIDHRINKVSWTTNSELFNEIRSLLKKRLEEDKGTLSEDLRCQIKQLLKNL